MRGLLRDPERLDGRAALCEFCGEPDEKDLFEVWGRDFQVEYCCEEAQDSWHLKQQSWDRKDWTNFVRSLPSADAFPLQRVSAGEGRVRFHWGLKLAPPPKQKVCREWIKQHHRHNAPPAGWKWAHAVYNGDDLVGIAWVGRPVSRVLQEQGIVEVNRCCVHPGMVPHDLVRNTCSMLYGAAVREAKRRKLPAVITYTRADESGVSVKAAGFEIYEMPGDKKPGIVRGKHWGHSGRQRKKHEIIDKVRWIRRPH